MEIERQRGISVTSTRFASSTASGAEPARPPGHRDFSEDTYRVLAATDTAVMVIDAAKGLEPQTLKLFRVCRTRGTPIITFINKLDRAGARRPGAAGRDRSRDRDAAHPITWPVFEHGAFVGLVDRRDATFIRYVPPGEGGGEATPVPLDDAGLSDEARARLADDLDLLAGVGADHDEETFAEGLTTPVFFGSALGDCGVRQLLEAVEDIGRAPAAWPVGRRRRAARRRTVLGRGLQGAGQHRPQAPRPHRVHAHTARAASSVGSPPVTSPAARRWACAMPTAVRAGAHPGGRRPTPAMWSAW